MTKFTVADNPAKYALYKRCCRDEQGKCVWSVFLARGDIVVGLSCHRCWLDSMHARTGLVSEHSVCVCVGCIRECVGICMVRMCISRLLGLMLLNATGLSPHTLCFIPVAGIPRQGGTHTHTQRVQQQLLSNLPACGEKAPTGFSTVYSSSLCLGLFSPPPTTVTTVLPVLGLC